MVKRNHWSTNKHVEAKSKVSAKYKKAKSSRLDQDWTAYKTADRTFKKMCHLDKNAAWRKYKESLQSEKEMAALAKLVQREERRQVNLLVRPDGSNTDPGTDTINLLTDTHKLQTLRW